MIPTGSYHYRHFISQQDNHFSQKRSFLLRYFKDGCDAQAQPQLSPEAHPFRKLDFYKKNLYFTTYFNREFKCKSNISISFLYLWHENFGFQAHVLISKKIICRFKLFWKLLGFWLAIMVSVIVGDFRLSFIYT